MRNEEKNAEPCLINLLNQPTISKIIVVDDGSVDNTAEIVRRYLDNNKVVLIASAESGWGCKANACHRGALVADTDWLLFVDADTRLSQDVVAKALSFSIQEKLDALSAVGALRCPHFWDKIAAPFSFGILNSFIKMSDVNTATRKAAYFYGSFILMKKESYFKVGGHAAVSQDLVEDRALAQLAKKNGLRIALAYASDTVSAEWAPGFRNSIEAFCRVAVPSMSKNLRLGAAFSFALTMLFVLPLASLVLQLFVPFYAKTFLTIFGSVSILFELVLALSSAHYIQSKPVYSALFLIPELVFAATLWLSVYKVFRRLPIRWRGRAYVYSQKTA
jgi:glycosyltransferase involved in cell wall biosynthesis